MNVSSVQSFLRSRTFVILGILSLGLSVTMLYEAARMAPLNSDNEKTFVTSHSTLEEYHQLRKEWRPRVLANASAHAFSQLASRATQTPEGHLRATVGGHTAIWLLLTNVLLIMHFREKALFYMWGTFAAVTFGYTPEIASRIYPWDMPALFFFTAFIVCWDRLAYRSMSLVILGGLLFKETTIVLCCAFLFLDTPLKKRLKYLVLTVTLFIVVKVAVDLAVGNPLPVLSMSAKRFDEWRLLLNVQDLAALRIAHPVWINAGTFLALLLLPNKNRTVLMLKCVASLFAVSVFLFGIIREYRIWFEAIPLALHGLFCTFNSQLEPNRASKRKG